MSMIFRFRMLSDENDNFVRDYDVRYDMTLMELHQFILQTLEYEDCIASFFTADDKWEKLHEFTSEDMCDEEGCPTPMDSVTLGQIIHNRRDRLIYLFDMLNDRAYYLELTEASRPLLGMEYPCEVYAQAEAPDQYNPSKFDPEGDGSAFDDIMGDFSDFEGDDNCGDD